MKTSALLAGSFLTPSVLAEAETPDPLFLDQAPLQVELTAPLSTLVRERSETEYLPGTFSFGDENGSRVELDVRVRARGNFRHANCDFPPLTLNFRKAQVDGTLFDRQDKLKLVAHCKITQRYEQTLLREYLAYRILNSVTDLSYRVRLLRVTYVDSEERRGRMVRHAFVIEHKDRLAARTGTTAFATARADPDVLEAAHLNLTSLYQYLIGNVDFSPLIGSGGSCCHNYDLFVNDAGVAFAIPYDFDLAAIVNAPYAEPDRALGVERIGQRAYQGFCRNNDQIGASVEAFRQARDSIQALVAGLQELEPSVRDNVTRYVDGFYAIINDPQEVERLVFGACQ